MIDGNTELTIKIHDKEGEDIFDELGGRMNNYINIASLFGWIDLLAGDSKYDNKAKIEDSTHIFICDYIDIEDIDIEDAKAVIKGKEYDIKYIDDPMGLHEHLEIYLKKVGGQ